MCFSYLGRNFVCLEDFCVGLYFKIHNKSIKFLNVFYGFSKFLVSNISSDCFSYFIIFIHYDQIYKNIFVVPVNTESVQWFFCLQDLIYTVWSLGKGLKVILYLIFMGLIFFFFWGFLFLFSPKPSDLSILLMKKS